MRSGPALALLLGLLLVGLATLLLLREPVTQDREHAERSAADAGAVVVSRGDADADVTLHAPGMATAPVEPLDSDLASDTVPDRDGNPEPVRISGRIVRASDGTPLPDAHVRLGARRDEAKAPPAREGRPERYGPVQVWTDEAGSFEVVGRRGRYASISVWLGRNGPVRSADFPLPDIDGDIGGLQFALDTGFTITGVVHDSYGAMLAGAQVSIESGPPVTTDASGRFELRDVFAGEVGVVMCVAQAPGHLRATQSVLVPEHSATITGVVFTLPESGAIAGSVTDAAGRPVAGLDVNADPTHASRDGPAHASRDGEVALDPASGTTDEAGAYRLDHLPAGHYLVHVGTTVLYGQHGRTDGNLSVNAWPLPADTAPEGDGPAARALAARWIEDVLVEPGHTTRLDIVLDGGAVVQGRVTDAAGAPVAAARLILRRTEGGTAAESNAQELLDHVRSRGAEAVEFLRPTTTTLTSDDGGFRFDHVPTGAWTLLASCPGLPLAAQSVPLTVYGTEPLSHLDFVLAEGVTLRGRVIDAEGAALEFVVVSLLSEPSNPFSSRTPILAGDSDDSDGWFELPGLAPRPHVIEIAKPGYATLFELVTPGETPRTFVLSPGPEIRLQVTGTLPGVVPNRVHIRVVSAGGRSLETGGEATDGRYHMTMQDDLPSSVTVSAEGYVSETREGIIPSTTATAPLHLVLKPKP